MLDRDEIQDSCLQESYFKKPEINRVFAGFDLSRYVCVRRSHCSQEFLAQVDSLNWEDVAKKNYQPFSKAVLEGSVIYRERIVEFSHHYPHWGNRRNEYFWVPKTICRRLAGSLGANYADYCSLRDDAVEIPFSEVKPRLCNGVLV